MSHWKDLVRFEVVPVITSSETSDVSASMSLAVQPPHRLLTRSKETDADKPLQRIFLMFDSSAHEVEQCLKRYLREGVLYL